VGREYQIGHENSLNDPDWQLMSTITGDGTVMIVSVPDPSDKMRFYQVRSP